MIDIIAFSLALLLAFIGGASFALAWVVIYQVQSGRRLVDIAFGEHTDPIPYSSPKPSDSLEANSDLEMEWS